MSIFQIHILMLAVAIVAGLLVAGSPIFRRPNSNKRKTGPCAQQRTLGFIAFIVVAAAPLIRLWRDSLADTALLQQSFLVAAIGLLALLLYALLQKPSTTFEPEAVAAAHAEQGPAPIQIDANAEAIVTEIDTQDSTVTLDKTDNQQPRPVEIQTSLSDMPRDIDVINEPINLGQAANDHEKSASSKGIDISNHVYLANLERVIEDNKTADISRLSIASTAMDSESLDLSETEELYAELRSQTEEIDLPDNDEWLADFDDGVDLDDSLVLADEHISTVDEQPTSIIDGELLQTESATIDDTALEFGDDLTGEYAHPDIDEEIHTDHSDTATDTAAAANAPDTNMAFDTGTETETDTETAADEPVPATLAETLAISRNQNTALQAHIDELNNKLVELQQLHNELGEASHQTQLTSAEMIVNREKLLDQESGAREAAESVIRQQREILSRSRHQQSLIKGLLQEERARLANMQREVEKSKATARQAAALARKAAIANQTIRDLAKREQQARLRSQESAKRAVDIARNAISALAAEERKNTFYRN